ncbi:MAG: 2-dehydropantoate 2-reductase [Deltaproteobacteria bacterium]|nr:2-dehydropantoate 2-reductase [Deltaproteobacteria bacterium]
MNPRILAVGTGAIGGFYGGKLAQAGARVSTLCRSDYETVKSEGIRVASTFGDFHFTPERVIRRVKEYGSPPDYLLVGLKVLPEINTPEIIREVVGSDTAIVLLQNGVEIEESVARAFPNNEIISGLAFICVTRTDPGHIVHVDFGRLVIGRFPAGKSDKTDHLARLFNESGVPCTVSEDVVTDRWRKLVWNAPFNPISVLGGGADTKTMVDNPESLKLARQVMEEVCRIAEAEGHPLPAGVVEENIEGTRRMSPYKSSMLVDFEAGRPMEVEAILGNGIRAAKRHKIAVPHMESLYGLLKLVDEKIRNQRSP